MSGKASQQEPSAGKSGGALAGAMFLMATSAVGPGFITQTTQFTVQLGAAFAFAILASVLVDVAVQLNVWRVIGVSGLRAQDLADRVWTGLGAVLAGIVGLGGLVFNVGNVAGAGLGLEALLGVPARWGGALSAALAVGVFLSRRAGIAMDRIVIVLGALMIVLTTYVAFVSGPPVDAVLMSSVLPERIDLLAITTLIGGTVGGYITYAGAHRLVDAGVQGVDRVREISRAAVTGVLLTGAMRVLLFLAVLGVVSAGHALDPAHPAASAFEAAAGEVGRRLYGLVLWAAAVTSVIGASYTSVSFYARAGASDGPDRSAGVVAFIAVSTAIYLAVGAAPVALLVFAGAFNGILLPAGLAVMLWIAARRADLLGGYRYPRYLIVIGLAGWLVTLYLGARSIAGLSALLR